ncbi:hypothetical protein [Corynebacterium uterequi]|uniref:Uncharacterized protein n=1 Tax=Corynebacterium uterequi TaxID=1072256 RepID=A0A0G3HEH2_9CORY|nr:hypothetical protein [Corynebacterium uterequi]AKK11684.1 hypothetical protein CUTER_08505 [Corynebacterium uterequi]
MPIETLIVRSGLPGLLALVSRAAGMDATASVRFRDLGAGRLDVFVTTPMSVVAARRIEGAISRDGAVVAATDLLDALNSGRQEIGPARDPNWPGALPPVSGFQLLDEVPASVVRQLADAGQALTRQFSGPMGPPAKLLDQAVLTVTADAPGTATGPTAEAPASVEVPMRMIFACTSLGLIPGLSAAMDVPRHLRVSRRGRWVRLDAPFGSVYRNSSVGGILPI